MLLYFSYTTYHTPSNTKSFEQHFCVRNNSGNMVVYTYMLVYWPTALLLMLHHHRRCGSGATLLRFLLGVAHGPPFFSSFVVYSTYDGKNHPLIALACQRREYKPPPLCCYQSQRHPASVGCAHCSVFSCSFTPSICSSPNLQWDLGVISMSLARVGPQK